MAEKKVWAQRSYRVAIRRQSFSLLLFFGVACRLSSLWLQRFTQPRCVVASVCQKRTVIGEEMLEDGCTLVVAGLSFSQQKQDRTPMPVTNNMEFGIQATFCSFYQTWRIPFLSRLAAVR